MPSAPGAKATVDVAIARALKVRPWKRAGQSAPHKPLLLLFALARVQQGAAPRMDFNDVEEPLRDLIERFGEGNARGQPGYPFWRLQHDELWEVEKADTFPSRRSNSDPPVTALRKQHARAGFPMDLDEALRSSPDEIVRFARTVAEHFFADQADEVLQAAGVQV